MERAEREKAVVAKMISIYCNRHHHTEPSCLCDECRQLLDYACSRIDRCPLGNRKSSCRKCAIHCYSPDCRDRIRRVMRYVGPRFIFIDPVAAVRHMISERFH